jgi:sulfate adenylyltransferase
VNSFWSPVSAPVHVLSGPQLDELELLLGGLYAPADGYCLPEDLPQDWPWAFTLPVPAGPAHEALEAGSLLLADPDGTPLARLLISAGQGSSPGIVHLAGRLTAMQPAEHPPARKLRLTAPLPAPRQPGSSRLIAAFDAIPELAQLAAVVEAAHRNASELWLVAVAGTQQHGGYTVLELLHGLEECAAQIPGARASLLIAPAPEGAGDTQLRMLRRHLLARLGADFIHDYTAAPAPNALGAAERPWACRGTVVLLTGLSGSGKSTIARSLVERLQGIDARPVTLLDGDDVRRMLSAGLGFSREDRELNVRRVGWVASLVAKSGGVAVCAPIAPFEATRREVRAMAEKAGSFVLVHIATPLEVCEQRDRKGLYARARAGDLQNFTGIDSPYEPPQDADVVVDSSAESVDTAVALILDAMGLAQPVPAAAAG